MATTNIQSIWALALVALLANCCGLRLVHCSSLTRSSGLIYPELAGNDYNYPNGQWPDGSAAGGVGLGPGKIRIDLRRHVEPPTDPSRLSEPKVSYYGTMAVGTPPKKFNVLFDTGYHDIWLPYYNWFPTANNLHYSDGYNCRDSSTCTPRKQAYTVMYRGTEFDAERYEDVFTFYQDVQMDGSVNFYAPRPSYAQNFLAVTSASDEQFRYKPYDAVIGLSPLPLSESGTKNILLSIWERQLQLQQQQLQQQQQQQPNGGQMMNQWNQMGPQSQTQNASMFYRQDKGLRSNYPQQAQLVFGLWYNPGRDIGHGGELTLGGVDETRFTGQFFYHSVISHFDWELKVKHVILGGEVVSCHGGCSALLDTGANSMAGPREEVENIYRLLDAVEHSGVWLVDCDRVSQFPKLTFVIDETFYDIPSSAYVRPLAYRNGVRCYLTIKPQDRQRGKWILGTSFIGQWYTVFDYGNKQIGFAAATL